MTPTTRIWAATVAMCSVTLLAACSGTDTASSPSASGDNTAVQSADGAVTVTNCGEQVTFTKADNLFVNDGNIIAMALSAGAAPEIKDVSSMQRDADILRAKYGDVVDSLNVVAKEYPSLEEIVAKHPDIYVAGWGYGFSESKNLTPDVLKDHGIDSYLLTESCRSGKDSARGVVDPWQAVVDDVTNLGAITGNEDTAAKVVQDQQKRLEALRTAAQAEKAPVGMVFDSGTDTVFTSGSFGAPQAIMEAAGATNATADVEDTWVSVSWEKIAESKPDFFAFVDYPPQTLAEKIALLESNPVTRDLPAVKEKRYINLPYAMWTSGPLNIDAAEHLRKGLEHFKLVPASDVTTELTLPNSVPGLEYFQD